MRKSALALVLMLAPLSCGSLAFSQDEPRKDSAGETKVAHDEAHFYKLTFIVQELDQNGKPTNGRSYTMTASTILGRPIQIRTNSHIPVRVNVGTNSLTQWQYVDAGVNFDVHEIHEIGKQVAFQVRADVTSIAPLNDSKVESQQDQVVRHNQWDSMVLIPLGKATPIFISDSLDSKGSMQVVVTATPLQ